MYGVMPVEERRLLVLKFLSDYPLALPLRPVYVNMRRKMGITFSQDTVKRRLYELVEMGYVEELDIGNGYYQISESGRDYLEAND